MPDQPNSPDLASSSEQSVLNSKSKNLLELGLLIPFLTALIFGSVYYHELGYFYRMGIPCVFIQVEPTKVIGFTSLFFGLGLALVIWFELLYGLLMTKLKKPSMTKAVGYGIVSVTLFLIFVLIEIGLSAGDTMFLMLTFSFGYFMYHGMPVTIIHEGSFLSNLSQTVGKMVGLFMTSFSLVCTTAFLIGVFKLSAGGLYYPVKKHTHEICLRQYTAYSIWGMLDSNNVIGKDQFFIQYSPTSADTINNVIRFQGHH